MISIDLIHNSDESNNKAIIEAIVRNPKSES